MENLNRKVLVLICAVVLFGALFIAFDRDSAEESSLKTLEDGALNYIIALPDEADTEILEESIFVGKDCLFIEVGEMQVYITDSGERCGEPTGLGVEDVKFDNKTITTSDGEVTFDVWGFNNTAGLTNFYYVDYDPDFTIIVHQKSLFEDVSSEKNRMVADIINSISKDDRCYSTMTADGVETYCVPAEDYDADLVHSNTVPDDSFATKNFSGVDYPLPSEDNFEWQKDTGGEDWFITTYLHKNYETSYTYVATLETWRTSFLDSNHIELNPIGDYVKNLRDKGWSPTIDYKGYEFMGVVADGPPGYAYGYMKIFKDQVGMVVVTEQYTEGDTDISVHFTRPVSLSDLISTSSFDDEVGINGKGELVDGNGNKLVSFENDMEIVRDTVNYPGVDEIISERVYLKGAVESFGVSPNGEYISYRTLDSYTGCCAGPNDIPVYKVWIMKSDGSEKHPVDYLEDQKWRFVINYKGWYPDSSGIMVYYQEPTEATQSSGVYKVALNGEILYRDESQLTPAEELIYE